MTARKSRSTPRSKTNRKRRPTDDEIDEHVLGLASDALHRLATRFTHKPTKMLSLPVTDNKVKMLLLLEPETRAPSWTTTAAMTPRSGIPILDLESLREFALTDFDRSILEACANSPRYPKQIAVALGKRSASSYFHTRIKRLWEHGLLEKTPKGFLSVKGTKT